MSGPGESIDFEVSASDSDDSSSLAPPRGDLKSTLEPSHTSDIGTLPKVRPREPMTTQSSDAKSADVILPSDPSCDDAMTIDLSSPNKKTDMAAESTSAADIVRQIREQQQKTG